MKKSLLAIAASVLFLFNTKAQTWTAMGSGAGIAVQCIVVDTVNNLLYAGGTGGVKKWDGNSWTNLGSPGTGAVAALAMYKGELYAGGSFTPGYIAKWAGTGTTWNVVASGQNGPVTALAVYNSNLVVAGSFTMSGGSVFTLGLANWNGTAWSAFGTPGIAGGSVYTLLAYNNELYMGGSLNLAGTGACAVLKWGGSSWSDLNTSSSSSTGLAVVNTLTFHKGELYAGGNFYITAKHVAKYSGSAWATVGAGTDSTVMALASYNNTLYAGGLFTKADGNTVNYIAQWNGTNWTDLAGGMSTSQPFVLSFVKYKSCLIAGGQFTKGGTVLSPDAIQWCAITTGIENNMDETADISVYPNPFTSTATLSTQSVLKNASCVIYDVLGKEIKRMDNLNGDSISIDRTNMRNGIYFCRLSQGSTFIGSKKIIVE